MGLGNTRLSTPWVGLGAVKAPSPYLYCSSGSAQGALPKCRRPLAEADPPETCLLSPPALGMMFPGSHVCLLPLHPLSLCSASYPFLSTYVILFHCPLSLQTNSFTYISCQASDRLPHPLTTFPSTDHGAGLTPCPQLICGWIG